MNAARATVTGALWWLVLTRLGGDPGSATLASLVAGVAGALAGGAAWGFLVAVSLVAGRALMLGPDAFEGLRRSLGASGALVSWWSALAPWVAPAFAGLVCGAAARRATRDSGATLDAEADLASIRSATSPGWEHLRAAHPSVVLAWLVRRKRWADAARLAEGLGMVQSAVRWWKAADAPEEAARVAERYGLSAAASSSRRLELAQRDRQPDAGGEAAPHLELENVREARRRGDDEGREP